MKAVQILIHVISEDENKFDELRSWDPIVNDTFHYSGCGDWYSNGYCDIDTEDGKNDLESCMSYMKDAIEKSGIQASVETEVCELRPVLM